jgi:carbon storage regulator
MLVLSRKECEGLFIGDDVVVEVREIRGNRVELGITAPSGVKILRCELKVRPTPTDDDKGEQRDAA